MPELAQPTPTATAGTTPTATDAQAQAKPVAETTGQVPAPVQVVEKKPETSKEDAARFASLAKKERATHRAQLELKAQQDALAKDRAEADAYKRDLENAKRHPEAHLKRIFGDEWYDTLTRYRLEGVPTAELVAASVDDKLEAFQKRQEEERRKLIESERAESVLREQQAIAEFQSEISDFIATNVEKYELIGLYDQSALVYQVIEEHCAKTTKRDESGRVVKAGRILSVEQAADQVESYLEEQVRKAHKAKKFQAKATPQPKGDEERINDATQRTLSNQMTASTQTVAAPPRTEKEAFQRALAILEGRSQ